MISIQIIPSVLLGHRTRRRTIVMDQSKKTAAQEQPSLSEATDRKGYSVC